MFPRILQTSAHMIKTHRWFNPARCRADLRHMITCTASCLQLQLITFLVLCKRSRCFKITCVLLMNSKNVCS